MIILWGSQNKVMSHIAIRIDYWYFINPMLKRRRRIQKYINALKLKKKGITKEDVDALKIEEEDKP